MRLYPSPLPFSSCMRSLPRVNSLCSRLQGRFQDLVGIEVAFERLWWPNADGFIGHSHVRSLAGKSDQAQTDRPKGNVALSIFVFASVFSSQHFWGQPGPHLSLFPRISRGHGHVTQERRQHTGAFVLLSLRPCVYKVRERRVQRPIPCVSVCTHELVASGRKNARFRSHERFKLATFAARVRGCPLFGLLYPCGSSFVQAGGGVERTRKVCATKHQIHCCYRGFGS